MPVVSVSAVPDLVPGGLAYDRKGSTLSLDNNLQMGIAELRAECLGGLETRVKLN